MNRTLGIMLATVAAAVAASGAEPPKSSGQRAAVHQGAPAGITAAAGDMTLENGKLAAVVKADGSGVELYGNGGSGWVQRGRLVAVADGKPLKSSGLKVATGGGAETAVQVALDGNRGAVFSLGSGDPALKATAEGKVDGLRFAVPCRMGIVPDFYADDMVVDARKIPIARAEMPNDHIFLHMAGGGDAIVAAVWEKGDRDLEIALSGEGEQRTIASTDVFFEEGGAIWAVVLAGSGIWYSKDVQLADIAPRKALDWAVPFSAKWKGNIVLRDGTIQSRQFNPASRDWYAGDVDQLVKNGNAFKAVFFWDFNKVNKFIDKAAFDPDFIVAYPISRSDDTPPDQRCVDDLLKLLNTERCAWILDLDGRQGGFRAGHETGVFTCNDGAVLETVMPHAWPRNEREVARFIKDERVFLRGINEGVIVFIKNIEDRINSYVAFKKDLLPYLDGQEKAHPELAEFIGRLKKQVTQPVDREAWDKLADGAERAQPNLEKRRQALRADTLENAAQYITAKFQGIGDPQDSRARAERMNVYRLRTMASMEMAMNPAAADLAREVRKRTREILRGAPAHEKPVVW